MQRRVGGGARQRLYWAPPTYILSQNKKHREIDATTTSITYIAPHRFAGGGGSHSRDEKRFNRRLAGGENKTRNYDIFAQSPGMNINLYISASEAARILKKARNWKASYVDGVRSFWYKCIEALYAALGGTLQNFLENSDHLSSFMIESVTYAITKNVHAGSPSDYRPIILRPSFPTFSINTVRWTTSFTNKKRVAVEAPVTAGTKS